MSFIDEFKFPYLNVLGEDLHLSYCESSDSWPHFSKGQVPLRFAVVVNTLVFSVVWVLREFLYCFVVPIFNMKFVIECLAYFCEKYTDISPFLPDSIIFMRLKLIFIIPCATISVLNFCFNPCSRIFDGIL